MTSVVCSLCREITSEENAAGFFVEVPQVGKRLSFRACVACQEKAKTHNLYICLGCKSVNWYPSGEFLPHGVKYHVKFRCNGCMSQAVSEAAL